MNEEPRLLTFSEIFELYPDLQKRWNWTNKHLIRFMEGQALRGYYSTSQKSYLCEEESLIELINYINKQILNSMVDIGQVKPGNESESSD